MEVTVQIHGALAGAPASARRLGFELPAEATVGDVVRRLAERLGAPFAGAAASRDARLPRELRLFIGGELAAGCDQRLATDGRAAPITVVWLRPIAGG